MTDKIKDVAIDFALIVREWVSDSEWHDILVSNDIESNNDICHSHDFCDANQAMLDAAEKHYGSPWDDKGEHFTAESNAIFDAAWKLAKARFISRVEWPALADDMTEGELCATLATFAGSHALLWESADEMLHSLWIEPDSPLAVKQREWLQRFIETWESVVE